MYRVPILRDTHLDTLHRKFGPGEFGGGGPNSLLRLDGVFDLGDQINPGRWPNSREYGPSD